MSDFIIATPIGASSIVDIVEQGHTIVTASGSEHTVVNVVEQGHTVITTFPGGPIIVGSGTDTQSVGQSVVASAALSGHRAIALVGGVAVYADCTVADHAYLTIGVSKDAVLAGSNLLVFNRQSIEDPIWNWVAGQPVFLGQGGLLTQSAPISPALFVLEVGIAISAYRLDVDVRRPIFI
jgi:hypothetical protein